MDLEEASHQEIFEELGKRNHSVVLLCAKMLDADRVEIFSDSSGGFVNIYGMLWSRLIRDSFTDLFTRYHNLRTEDVSDDALDDDED